MKCVECKWYAGSSNDAYGVCKRYPQIANKGQHDWCGEFFSKVVMPDVTPIKIKFEEPTVYEYVFETDEIKPKRGRKPKA
jgi:hypothetical protein